MTVIPLIIHINFRIAYGFNNFLLLYVILKFILLYYYCVEYISVCIYESCECRYVLTTVNQWPSENSFYE